MNIPNVKTNRFKVNLNVKIQHFNKYIFIKFISNFSFKSRLVLNYSLSGVIGAGTTFFTGLVL